MNGDRSWARRAYVRELPPAEQFDLRGRHVFFVLGSFGLILMAGAIGYFFAGDVFSDTGLGELTPAFWVAIGLGTLGIVWLFAHGGLLRNTMKRRVGRREGRLFDPATEACKVVEIEEYRTFRKFKMKAHDMGLICARNGWLDLELSQHRARFPLNELRIVPVRDSHTGCVELHYENEMPPWRVVATVIVIQKFDPRDFVQGMSSQQLENWIRAGEVRVCRRCKYDLRSVAADRCPECGAACVANYQIPFGTKGWSVKPDV